ncbi:unnamed protein product [Aphanomyces euteiches]|uniref:N-acetyltransferase domain-containing protein n=1 Tax=Aphanomyces euteiches TaxID=100861 RepID=A0A6G0XPN6_9STRA|nr:hypothetical protein Ae201684_002553 [Aphanomyces euteiches]KAH9092666.1 hypothetical protein Ae201684P_008336 [Aphanomyces euteiches]KAH9116713.1 hypothetical protein AeMF1_009359 [Aphanomyces euteiches]KAH9126860.1 hypothetical protein LEN26_009338 [Aphanomyces euteiches]KAH9146318.1 hypothetical protein AeRB84_009796 [Aphanomyces euteiches]
MQVIHVDEKTPRQALEQVVAIETASFPAHESLGTAIVDEAKKQGHVMLLAVDVASSSVLGYVLYSRNSIAGRVVKIAVHPSKRRLGIGRTLLQQAIRLLSNCMCITLHVAVRRDGAFQLYESLGFQVQDCRRDYYAKGHDAFFMELSKSDYSRALS